MTPRTRIVMLITVFSLIGFCRSVMAHNLWLNPDNYYPQVGATVNIGIGWGHKYPADRTDQEVKEDRVEVIRAVDPDGLPVPLTRVSAALYALPVEKVGAYLVIAGVKPGFFTMTTKGRRWGDKTSVENPMKCTNFHIEAKTVILAGGKDTHLGHAAGQSLEVIPLTDPHQLKPGDKLTVKVLFEGGPLADAAVKATYAGFETDDIAPRGRAPKGEARADEGKKAGKNGMPAPRRFPVETVTDASGQAVLQPDQAGYWMILLSHKPPFADPKICDEYMYNVAFTFEIPAKSGSAH